MFPSRRLWLFTAALNSVVCVASGAENTSSSAAAARVTGSACSADCTVQLYGIAKIGWTTISAKQTVTDQILYIYDEEAETTETITKSANHDTDLTRITMPPVNDAGTVTQPITYTADGERVVTTLTYPTGFVNWPSTYVFEGSLSTTISGQGVCLSESRAILTYPSSYLGELPQPSPTIPPGGNKNGVGYTTYAGDTVQPSSFFAHMSNDGVGAFASCKSALAFPASAVQEVLVLTSTSVSTKKKAATTNDDSNTTDGGPKQTAEAQQASSSPEAQPSAAPAPTTAPSPAPRPALSPAPTVNLGGQTLVPSIVGVPASQGAVVGQASPATTPAIAIGTHTLAIGQTSVFNGVTVVATTGADAKPALAIGGSQGTSTVAIGNEPSATGPGGAIASGLGYTGTSGSDAAAFTGSATRLSSRFSIWLSCFLGTYLVVM